MLGCKVDLFAVSQRVRTQAESPTASRSDTGTGTTSREGADYSSKRSSAASLRDSVRAPAIAFAGKRLGDD